MNSEDIGEQGYSFDLVNIECMPGSTHFNVVMELEESVEELLPYLAAVLPGCTYIHGSEVVHFMEAGHIVAIYPRRITITDVRGTDEGRELSRHYFEKVLQVKQQKESITPVYEKRSGLRVLDIFRALPQTNCGLCRLPTCMAFAAKVFSREARIAECEPFIRDAETNRELIRQLQSNGYEIS